MSPYSGEPMHLRIIHPNADSTVTVLTPITDCGLSIEQIAAKDIPAGVPWRIVKATELPSGDSRSRWRWTDSGPLSVEEEAQ